MAPLPPVAGFPGRPVLGFLAGATMVRRSAFREAGGFEARFFLGCEEQLLAVDLAARGWTLAYVEDVVVHHFPSSRRDREARRRIQARNTLWFYWLRRPARRALRETGRLARAALADPIVRRGLADALAGLAWVCRSRRRLPPDVERALRLVEACGPPTAPRAGAAREVSAALR
jgi:GT2 family glycosyltransferase